MHYLQKYTTWTCNNEVVKSVCFTILEKKPHKCLWSSTNCMILTAYWVNYSHCMAIFATISNLCLNLRRYFNPVFQHTRITFSETQTVIPIQCSFYFSKLQYLFAKKWQVDMQHSFAYNPSVRINYTAGNKMRVVAVTRPSHICLTECLQRSKRSLNSDNPHVFP
jgi:hypothetical protein